MYGVALDPIGNYLLLGGSGDEYSYSETNPDGWSSDIWVSYLVVLDTKVSVEIIICYSLKSAVNSFFSIPKDPPAQVGQNERLL